MGQLIYPQKREIKGPWLISQEDFESLDKVVIIIDNFLKQSWYSQIKSEVYSENKDSSEDELNALIKKREERTYSNKHEVKCQFTTKDGHKLSDKTIAGLLKDSSLKTLAPKEFNVSIIHGEHYSNKFDLRISELYNGELKYEIESFDSSIRDDIQYEIDKWIDKLSPNRILQFWSNYTDFFAYILFFPLIMLAVYTFSTSYTSYNDVLNDQAFTIVSQGVDSTNMATAIEVLLKSEIGYVPEDFVGIEKPKNSIFIRLLVIGVIIYLSAIIRPKTILGVGKMKRSLNFYKFWIKFILITLPSILVLAPFWNKLIEWLY